MASADRAAQIREPLQFPSGDQTIQASRGTIRSGDVSGFLYIKRLVEFDDSRRRETAHSKIINDSGMIVGTTSKRMARRTVLNLNHGGLPAGRRSTITAPVQDLFERHQRERGTRSSVLKSMVRSSRHWT